MAAKTMKATRVSVNGSKCEAAAKSLGYVIPKPNIQRIRVAITGTTPLIVHAWSAKARNMMLRKQTGEPVIKEKKDPQADYQGAFYTADEGWHGVPAAGFKAALVGACRAVDDLPMTLAKRMCFVLADGRSTAQNIDLVRIHGEPRMREDMVRLESGVADIRFRPEFPEWSAELVIEFNAGIITAEQIVNLCDLAGYCEGVCEWRPSAPKSATGSYGRWTVDRK